MNEIKTLVARLDILEERGYKEDYKVNKNGLKALKTGKIYSAEEVKVVNFYRINDPSYSREECILYVIQTRDGGKGTLIDSFGDKSDPLIIAFMKRVEEIADERFNK